MLLAAPLILALQRQSVREQCEWEGSFIRYLSSVSFFIGQTSIKIGRVYKFVEAITIVTHVIDSRHVIS